MPYRHVNNWILDTGYLILDTGYLILDTGYSIAVNGSLVNIVNMDKLDHKVAYFVRRLRSSYRLR